eukprot:scaffold26118_cov47-Phaeocystis_antarctica.AAC.2
MSTPTCPPPSRRVERTARRWGWGPARCRAHRPGRLLYIIHGLLEAAPRMLCPRVPFALVVGGSALCFLVCIWATGTMDHKHVQHYNRRRARSHVCAAPSPTAAACCLAPHTAPPRSCPAHIHMIGAVYTLRPLHIMHYCACTAHAMHHLRVDKVDPNPNLIPTPTPTPTPSPSPSPLTLTCA